MHSKVSSDWLPSYIKTTRPVLEIFKMAGYLPDRPRTYLLERNAIVLVLTLKRGSTVQVYAVAATMGKQTKFASYVILFILP